MEGFKKPAEIAKIWLANGIAKARMKPASSFLLAIFAGMFIGFGALAFIIATSPADADAAQTIFLRFLGASVFPVGLMLVIYCGAELFTGNNLLTLAVFKKEISFGECLKNWVIVYLGNLVGAVLFAYLISISGLLSGAFGEKAVAIAQTKASLPFVSGIVRGIFCNILVVLACWFQAGANEMSGKIFAVWFPIMLFVFLGFEHSVANMTYIPLGMMLGADVSFAGLISNLASVTIGNIVGGALIVSGVYYYCYLKDI